MDFFIFILMFLKYYQTTNTPSWSAHKINSLRIIYGIACQLREVKSVIFPFFAVSLLSKTR